MIDAPAVSVPSLEAGQASQQTAEPKKIQPRPRSENFHSAILVTCSCPSLLTEAHAEAVKTGLPVSPILPASTGLFGSFMVAPDGVRVEDAALTKKVQGVRFAFRNWLHSKSSDGLEPRLSWVQVEYGGELKHPGFLDFSENPFPF